MKNIVKKLILLSAFVVGTAQAGDLPSCKEDTDGLVCQKVFKQLNRYMKKGSPEAANFLAMIYMIGDFGVEADPKKAVELYRRAARERSAVAQYELAKLHFFGEHVELDRKKAMNLMKSAAKRGYSDAAAMYNFIMLEGATTEADKHMYVTQIKEMTNKYDFDVDYFLGRYYLKEKNAEEAKRHLVMASNDGHKPARDLLAMYFPQAREESPELFGEEFERILVTGQRPDINESARDLIKVLRNMPQYKRRAGGTRISGKTCTRDNSCHLVFNKEHVEKLNRMYATVRYWKVFHIPAS